MMTAVGLLCAGCGAANQNRTTSANAASVRPVWKGYKNADGSDYIAPKTNDGSWDSVLQTLSHSESYSEMAWESAADTSGRNNGSNYIDSIHAGERKTVTIGFLTDEDQISRNSVHSRYFPEQGTGTMSEMH